MEGSKHEATVNKSLRVEPCYNEGCCQDFCYGDIYVGITVNVGVFINKDGKYSLQGTTQGNGLTGGVPPVRFSM